MFHLIAFIVVFNGISPSIGWNPSHISSSSGIGYKLVWQDEFENVGPSKAIINGKPAYAPNPKNWAYVVGSNISGGIQNYTDSIQNAYVQDGQLTIVAMNDSCTSAMLRSQYLQEFIFGLFSAKIRLPYSQGMWPGWRLIGNGDPYHLSWPTVGEIDIVQMAGGSTRGNLTDRYAHATLHWNNQSNTMDPVYDKFVSNTWKPPGDSSLHDHSFIYWAEWTDTNINIGVDEFTYFKFNTTNIPDSINPVRAFTGYWPFYMVLNLAVGGAWAGPPDNTTVWPQQMVVDWVRIYGKKGPPPFDKY